MNIRFNIFLIFLILIPVVVVRPASVSLKDSADFVVAKDGSGNFTSLQAAVNAVPDYRKKRTVIYIKNGVYNEKVIIPASKQFLALVGESAEKTVIAYGDWAQKKNILGEDIGTSGSSTIYIYGTDFYAENISFSNTAGPVGQAVAAHVSADRSVFYNCRFLGFQDTLYTYAENSRQYYKKCYIEGTTDFIFGKSVAVFDQCEIRSKADSYITAAATPETTLYGYLFYKCKLSADSGVTKVYLGRPWRIYAKTVFRECELGRHILSQGWHDWSKPEVSKTAFYAEYKNYGEGSGVQKRVKWSHQLTDQQAMEWTVENVLKGNDDWRPTMSE
jgi:pectinesterase